MLKKHFWFIISIVVTVIAIILNIEFLGGTVSAGVDNIVVSVVSYILWLITINRYIVKNNDPKDCAIKVTAISITLVITSLLFTSFGIITFIPFWGIAIALIHQLSLFATNLFIYLSFISLAWISYLTTKPPFSY